MSTTLAAPPGKCCWTAIKHSGTPEGRTESLGGLDTYVAEPSANAMPESRKQVILFLSDAFGPFFINNKLLQDFFASRGFLVLGPDYFLGVPVQALDLPSDSDKMAWALDARAMAIKVFPKWFEEIKAKYGPETKYVAVGYCFGAPFVLDLAADESILAGAIAHPSFLEESHFQKLSRPLLLSCAEDDIGFPLEARRRAEDILISNQTTYFFQVFSGVSHGFAVKGDPSVPDARWAKEECARGMTEWFSRFLA